MSNLENFINKVYFIRFGSLFHSLGYGSGPLFQGHLSAHCFFLLMNIAGTFTLQSFVSHLEVGTECSSSSGQYQNSQKPYSIHTWRNDFPPYAKSQKHTPKSQLNELLNTFLVFK